MNDEHSTMQDITSQYSRFLAQIHEMELKDFLRRHMIPEDISPSELEQKGYVIVKLSKNDGEHRLQLLKIVDTKEYKTTINISVQHDDATIDRLAELRGKGDKDGK